MPDSTEINVEIRTSDGVTICKQSRLLVTKGKLGMGETDVWRGMFALEHCQRKPELGETLLLRHADGSEETLVVVDVTGTAVHFRIKTKPRSSSWR